jgi:GAF domain-containing protein
MRGWVAGARENAALLPRPRGVAQAHAEGSDADRVLLIGSGAAVGFGVFSYDLSLGGMLARALANCTDRGVDVDIVARAGMTAASALDRLAAMPLWRYEAIVVAVGLNEALDLASLSGWHRSIGQLLDHLTVHTTPGTAVIVLGVPPMHSMPARLGPMGLIAQRHAAKLDRVSSELSAERPRAQFVSLNEPVIPRQRDVPAGEDYRVAADVIAEIMAPAVTWARRHPARVSVRSVGYINEEQRQLAVDSFEVVVDDQVRRIVDLARELFGTSGAVLSVLDGDTSRHVVHVGLDYDTLDRANTFCNFTIQGRGALIVPDATADARFADNPYVVGDPRIRFYAGFPIEAPGGEPIGALCVFDQDPRRASQIDEVLLRRLALQVQQQLHGQLVG